MIAVNSQLRAKLMSLVKEIYPDEDAAHLSRRVIEAFWPDGKNPRQRARQPGNTLWSEKDSVVITYGNSVMDGQHKPLDLLSDFLRRYLADAITGVHILPFFPFTSDDGFAVTDYEQVNSTLGDWADINRIGDHFRLMSDLVLNHMSAQSKWFNEYLQGHEPYDRYFFEASPDDDLSAVVRPRAHALLREVETANGPRHVWCTFSYDQVDLNFANPDVLVDLLRIMRLHIANGVRIIRLDAVAFIWKEIGTSCIHLPQTHAIVRLMRLLVGLLRGAGGAADRDQRAERGEPVLFRQPQRGACDLQFLAAAPDAARADERHGALSQRLADGDAAGAARLRLSEFHRLA